MRPLVCWLALLLWMPCDAFAGGPGDLKFELAFNVGGTPWHNAIQDRQGFLWFTTAFNGLARFDGSGVKYFRAGPRALATDNVTQVFEDSQGMIWVGTNRGLTRYDKRDDSFVSFFKNPAEPATSLAGNGFSHYSTTIAEDEDGLFWFGTSEGLSSYDRKTGRFASHFHRPDDAGSLPSNDIRAVLAYRRGSIWVGTMQHGLPRFDIRQMVRLRDGRLWVWYTSGRVDKHDPEGHRFEVFRHNPLDPKSVIRDGVVQVLEDRRGNVWMGTSGEGLERYHPDTGEFEHFRARPGDPTTLPQNYPNALLEDRMPHRGASRQTLPGQTRLPVPPTDPGSRGRPFEPRSRTAGVDVEAPDTGRSTGPWRRGIVLPHRFKGCGGTSAAGTWMGGPPSRSAMTPAGMDFALHGARASECAPSDPPGAWGPLVRMARFAGRPLEQFLRIEAASGIVLLAAAAVALGWANSPWAGAYASFWHTPVGLRIGSFAFERPVEWFVNDVLMVVFFFVVGLEIRREIHHGELSDARRAALPILAALAGMVVPA